MRARGTSGAVPSAMPDRQLWRRSQETAAPPHDDAHLLDLAAFADGRLDVDDSARIACLLARDADAAADIAAARVLAGATMSAPDAAIIARAQSLVDGTPAGEPPALAELIAFPVRRSAQRPWYSAASWSGLAAAVVLAGWLGFDLGTGFSASPSSSRSGDDVSASELLDPAPLLLREFSENSQI